MSVVIETLGILNRSFCPWKCSSENVTNSHIAWHLLRESWLPWWVKMDIGIQLIWWKRHHIILFFWCEIKIIYKVYIYLNKWKKSCLLGILYQPFYFFYRKNLSLPILLNQTIYIQEWKKERGWSFQWRKNIFFAFD